jgi:predicted RNA-binding protein YlxR (DUF448 family)
MTDRACTKCGEAKPVSEFFRKAAHSDGLDPQCKECKRAVDRAYRAENPDARLEAKRRYGRAHPEQVAARSSSYRREQPEKARAQDAVKKALRRGDLVRPGACDRCGVACKPHGHHDDYSRRLSVHWLCRKCHASVHQEVSYAVS